MSDWTSKPRPGDPLRLPAQTVGNTIDAARVERSHRFDRERPAAVASLYSTAVIRILNDTGDDLTQGSVVKLGDPIVTASENLEEWQAKPSFTGTVPDATDNDFAILLEPIPDGQIGRGIMAGIAQVTINVTDAGHRYATPTSGDATKLTSAETGPAKIEWVESGTGDKRATVLLLGVAPGAGSSYTADDASGITLAAFEFSLYAATDTQQGAVSTTTQTFAGEKRFLADVVLNYNTTSSTLDSRLVVCNYIGTNATPFLVIDPYQPTTSGHLGKGSLTLGTLGQITFSGAEDASGSVDLTSDDTWQIRKSSADLEIRNEQRLWSATFIGGGTNAGIRIAADMGGVTPAYWFGSFQGATGTSGGGDTVKGGIITTLGTGTGITQLTGDVTAGPGSGSQAATIANGAVTVGKLAPLDYGAW